MRISLEVCQTHCSGLYYAGRGWGFHLSTPELQYCYYCSYQIFNPIFLPHLDTVDMQSSYDKAHISISRYFQLKFHHPQNFKPPHAEINSALISLRQTIPLPLSRSPVFSKPYTCSSEFPIMKLTWDLEVQPHRLTFHIYFLHHDLFSLPR